MKECYAHIDHERLYAQLGRWTNDRQMLRPLWGCLHRSVETGGIYRTIRRGISRGCPRSPLFGALYLNELDDRMAERVTRL